MISRCPNCDKEFIERNDTAFHCEDCGWFKNVDGEWHSCPEPPIDKEPDPEELNVPAQSGPVLINEPDKFNGEAHNKQDRPDPLVREYLGGLVTVTTDEDEDEEND